MLFLQFVLLDLSAHGAVEYHDALLEELAQVVPQSVNVYFEKQGNSQRDMVAWNFTVCEGLLTEVVLE